MTRLFVTYGREKATVSSDDACGSSFRGWNVLRTCSKIRQLLYRSIINSRLIVLGLRLNDISAALEREIRAAWKAKVSDLKL